ncbi:MAG: histidine--tRNA ligase [Ottowia sp.]|nr:histidine--tRNA ligase [Ottowia sp.]
MSKQAAITAVKGMNDILPPQSARWQWLEAVVRQVMAAYAYRNVRTPIVEQTHLFVRGLGAVTDVVEKEMYSFDDRADKRGTAEQLSLRPENTAGVVRATIEHNLLYDGGKRLYYMGPMFRRERPQRGRYRQFHQVGAEALGFGEPALDAEIILLAAQLWSELGLSDWRLELNCLGEPDERRAHRAALIAYFEQHEHALDADARRRLHSNPLRILDTKNPDMQALVEGAPRLMDYLGEASRAHFDAVQQLLAAAGLAYSINPRLVRGLDYYNLTVFEFVTDRLGAQGTICGGGRYDYLIAQIGGKPAPAVGWALGVERVLELLGDAGGAADPAAPDAYAVIPDPSRLDAVLPCLQALRAAGVHVQMHGGGSGSWGSMKSQLKRADASGARFALIFGERELQQGQVAVKALRDGSGEQTLQPLAQPGQWAGRLKSAR